MVKIIQFRDINEVEIILEIKRGSIFIYPTDTIYGLGCNATNSKAVKRIRLIKERYDKPFSVIAPSLEWILNNFKIIDKKVLKKLPGPYTLILNCKKNVVTPEVNLSSKSVGIRIPKHNFSEIIKKANVPFVTTSVNKMGEEPIKDIKNIKPNILKEVDIIIDDGILNNKPSTIIDLTGKEPKVILRK